MEKRKYIPKAIFEGCMLGLAIGDALGMPCEDLSRSEIVETFGRIKDYQDPLKGMFNYGRLKAGMYTDDTEQALVLAESIIETKGFDASNFAEKLLGEYGKNIIEHPELDRWIGGTFEKAVFNYISGKPATECGVMANTCGSAMRAAPIGLDPTGFRRGTRTLARESSRITHLGNEAVAGAEAVALYVDSALTKNMTPSQIDMISIFVGSQSDVMKARLDKAYRMRKGKPEDAVKALGGSQLALEVVPTAIYAFHHSPNDFEEAVLTAVNMGGDTDSRATITGAISGTYLGSKQIPNRWVKGIENREKLVEVANKIRNMYEFLPPTEVNYHYPRFE